MNDHQKRNPRLRQTVIVAVCVLAVLLFLYLSLIHISEPTRRS